MEYVEKIVKFGDYCKTCKFFETPENDEPCEECLSHTVREHSEKPVKYEEK